MTETAQCTACETHALLPATALLAWSWVAQRLLYKFSPFRWSKWRWQAFSSLKRTAQVFAMVAVTMLLELNAFMVMNALEVRTVCFFFGIGGDGRRRVGEGGAGGGGILTACSRVPACLLACPCVMCLSCFLRVYLHLLM